MGISKSIIILLAAVAVFFASAANAQDLGGLFLPVRLNCSAIGNSTGGLVVPGTSLNLACGGVRLATATTGSNGEGVLIFIGNIFSIISRLPLNCSLTIPLDPAIGCNNLATIGSLIGSLALTNLTNTLSILPNVQVTVRVLAVVGPLLLSS